MDTMPSTGEIFLSSAVKHFSAHKQLGDRTLAQLTEAELHATPNATSNSIAVIVQHLHGNMLSRFTDCQTTDGEKPWRERDAEFEEKMASRERLLQLWEQGWDCVFTALSALRPEDLLTHITIRQEPHTILDAINRQLTHYAYHVGQITWIGKMLRDEQWQNLSMPKRKP